MASLYGFRTRRVDADDPRFGSPLGSTTLVILFALYATSATAAEFGDHRHGVVLEDLKATAVIRSCAEDRKFLGVATLREAASKEGIKEVSFVLQITKPNRVLSPGKHAVHIHETGQCEPSCGDAGGHFDPGPFGMANPDANHPYHMGDLVNLEVFRSGQGVMRTITNRVTLSPGPLTVFDDDGSAVIVHVDPDTYCPEGGEPGCAGGARAACGVIE